MFDQSRFKLKNQTNQMKGWVQESVEPAPSGSDGVRLCWHFTGTFTALVPAIPNCFENWPLFSLLQKCRMIGNMLTNKTGNEVIAMIVAFVEVHID